MAGSTVLDLLRDLEKESPRFEEFGLVPHFAADEFMELLDKVQNEQRQLAYEILVPYLDSLRARNEALEEAEQLLRALISIMNDYLVDKKVTFTPKDGLTIVTDDGVLLGSAALSSGERQLTMLLCTTILAGRDSRLFIIDEPELSLGVAWQREILEALLALTKGTALQFIVATHSVEIISGQPESLVRLVRQRNAKR
jgi:ABC-type glutathione transport system ATPase component